MKRRFRKSHFFVVILSAWVSCSQAWSGNDRRSTEIGSTNESIRELHLPERSLGALLLVRPYTDYDLDGAPRLGIAKGAVTVRVPNDRQLMLDLNRNVVECPALMQHQALAGIDRLKVNLNGLDEVEHVADRVLQYLSPSLRFSCLDVHASDATDAGLKYAAKITSLTDINASHCEIFGSSISTIATLPNLIQLNLSFCPLKTTNLQALGRFTKLQNLEVRFCDLDDDGVRDICTASSIEKLNLDGNKRITDRAIEPLLRLRKLKTLNIKETAVTLVGVAKLSKLHLQVLVVPFKNCRPDDKAKLQMCFPNTKLVFDRTPALTDWQKTIFSPLK